MNYFANAPFYLMLEERQPNVACKNIGLFYLFPGFLAAARASRLDHEEIPATLLWPSPPIQ